MSENVSPNPIQRKLIQTKLIFTKNKLSLDSKSIDKQFVSSMSTKRLKTDDNQNVKCFDVESDVESEVESSPGVDPQLGNSVSHTSVEIIENEDQTNSELSLEINMKLLDDCSDNNPVVKALQTMDQLKEECTSIGLVLDEELCEDSEESVNTSDNVCYEVEVIYDTRRDEDRVTRYFVKWKNYSEVDNTWEPLSNLMGCRHLVEEFNFIKNGQKSSEMDVYHNYYKLKAIIEDVVEMKIPSDVRTTLLIIFNDIQLKDFNYTKNSINKMRSELRDTHLSRIDKISQMKRAEKRVSNISTLYHQLIQDLNILKRFDSFKSFYDFFIKRKQTDLRLNRWQHLINAIIDKQKEGTAVRLENFVDCEIPPPNFDYISNCKTNDPNIVMNEEPPIYCECEDCETESNECCVATNQTPINYTKNGILKDSRNNRNAIYECNKRCKCTQNCINRVVQKGRKHKLAIFRTDDGRGWGVRALEPIQKGSYVMEYVGEIISVEEADRRGHIYDAEGRTYLFDLDYTPDEIAKFTLDATQCGNVSHFVNHSCDPNLDTRMVWINNLDPFMPHIALFAVRNIKLNEELTFDYKISVHGITDADENQNDETLTSDKSFDSGIEKSLEAKPLRVQCRCSSHNCRKFLY